MYQSKFYTAENVALGHPDKVCDQISDAILDEILRQDSNGRVAMEAFGSHGLLVLGGEVTAEAEVDYEAVARRVYSDIGYHEPLEVLVHIACQSPDIARGVDTGGAGDQGIMYGYATDETPEYLPTGVVLARQLAQGLAELGRSQPGIGPDGKTQVTMENGMVCRVLVSCQHGEGMELSELRQMLVERVIVPVCGRLQDGQILVNPTGRFVQGGFAADAGLTGRKIMVDTYGGLAPHGGGAFSGKDPSKVDRSAAYLARLAAKHMVSAGLAHECLVSVAYAIGQEQPLMVSAVSESGQDLSAAVKRHFDFRPLAIIERLGLRRPIYRQTACFGHFGRPGLPWEEL